MCQYCFARCRHRRRRLSSSSAVCHLSSVVVCNTRWRSAAAGPGAWPVRRLTLHSGTVRLCPIMATPYFNNCVAEVASRWSLWLSLELACCMLSPVSAELCDLLNWCTELSSLLFRIKLIVLVMEVLVCSACRVWQMSRFSNRSWSAAFHTPWMPFWLRL